MVLRPGNAGSNTAADHIEAARLALAQLPRQPAPQGPGPRRFRRRHARVPQLADREVAAAALLGRHDDHRGHAGRDREGPGRRVDAGLRRRRAGPRRARGSPTSPACWTCHAWPAGMRVIVRKERPHPGAQLRFTDIDGHRFTAFATDANKGQLADLELRHRRRARCEDRIRNAKDTGLRNLPLKGFAQNQVWCEIVALACELLAWTQMLALTGTARRWEPKRLRLRLFAVAGRLASRRPPPAAPPRRTLALGRRHHRRGHPAASHPVRLTSRNRPCDTRRRNHQGPWNPAHPARQPGSQGTARC